MPSCDTLCRDVVDSAIIFKKCSLQSLVFFRWGLVILLLSHNISSLTTHIVQLGIFDIWAPMHQYDEMMMIVWKKKWKTCLEMQVSDQFEGIYVHKQTLGCVLDRHCVVCWHKIFPVGRLPCQFNRQVPPNQRPEMCARYRTRASQAEMNATPSGKCVGIYLKRNRILTVGDGDFSFSLALMSESNKLKLRLTATSHESFETVTTVYPNCHEILKSLKSLGATVLHTVDATNLASCKSIALNSFDTVVWNFPCIKGETTSADGQYSEIELNRTMLRLFFVNVQPYLRKDGKREIHVTHKSE